MTTPQQSEQTPDEGPNQRPFDVLDLAILLAKRMRLIISFAVGAAIVSAVVSLLLPLTFTGVARILPPQQGTSSLAAAVAGQMGRIAGMPDLGLGLKNPADLYAGMLRSRTIADRLIEQYQLKSLYQVDTMVEARKQLDDATTIRAGRDGIVIVEVEDEDPKRAADLANAYVAALDKLTQNLAVTDAGQRRLFLEKQLKQSKENLAEAEVALKKTQESTGLILLDEQGRAAIGAVATLRAHIATKEVQLSGMTTFATDANPEYRRVREELSGLRKELRKLEQSTSNGGTIPSMNQVPEAGLEYIRRFRDVKYHETLFELIARQYELARAEEAKDSSALQIVDAAVPPDKRTRPKRTLIVVVSTVLFTIFGMLAALALEYLGVLRASPRASERLLKLRQHLQFRRQ